MGENTKIEWTDATWNPITGCSVVSPGCNNCYAMRMAARLEKMLPPERRGEAILPNHYVALTTQSKAGPVWTGRVNIAPEHVLTKPLRWRCPRKIFVNSMGDLFHELVPDAWIDRVFAVMALAPQHTFQVLTKRAGRMRAYLSTEGKDGAENRIRYSAGGGHGIRDHWRWPLPNVWLGASAEDQRRYDDRAPDLQATPAAVHFFSFEPLLGPIQTDYLGEWAIVGGESGPGARPMHPQWARDIRDQCAEAGVPFHFKQHGEWIGVPDLRHLPGGAGPGFGIFDHCQHDMDAEAVRVGKARAGRLLDGVEHNGMPISAAQDPPR